MNSTDEEATMKPGKKRAERWEQILIAAEQCFAVSGFHGAGISKIAQSCEMSVGHLYHYVENKEALIEAVIRRELDRQMARLIELETATPGELADALLQKVSEHILYETEIFRTVLSFETLAEAQRNPKVAQILHEHDLNMRVRFCSMLTRFGVDSPEVKTELLFTIFGGLHTRAVRHPEQERGAMMDTIVPILRKIIKPPQIPA
ncbi:MAG: TetR/AcrR family transcriptional regulator [Hyphomonas sp.]|nr:TetR/AcrR family transcriptional regulator [Hyphomonas sp.]